MIYLLAKDILLIHHAVIQETGGSHGVRDMGLLESALAQPQQTFGGQDLYPVLEAKAATFFISLVKNHPFVDGNKRTAITATGVFLTLNGFQLSVQSPELVDFVSRIAASQPKLDEVAAWLKKNSHPV
jgi:death on curing protein